MISVCLDKKILRDFCCDVTCISTKIEDGGHFIPFNQNICKSKQDMKKSIIYSLKSSFKRENKNIYCHSPLIYIAISHYICITRGKNNNF